ncbi:phage tail protein [Escherichia coli]|nr:phage tail protein [Escherichia coli]
MTVSTVVDHNDYTGNGVTTSFPYTFRIFVKTDLVVSVMDLNDNITTLNLDTDYIVTNAGSYAGGAVQLAAPLANGWKISIARELEPIQKTDLRNQGKFFAETHENAFDYLTMLIQRTFSVLRLALLKPSWLANYYDALGNRISNLADPKKSQDAATKKYVQDLYSGVVKPDNIDNAMYVTDLANGKYDSSRLDMSVGYEIKVLSNFVRINGAVYRVTPAAVGMVTEITSRYIVAGGIKSYLSHISRHVSGTRKPLNWKLEFSIIDDDITADLKAQYGYTIMGFQGIYIDRNDGLVYIGWQTLNPGSVWVTVHDWVTGTLVTRLHFPNNVGAPEGIHVHRISGQRYIMLPYSPSRTIRMYAVADPRTLPDKTQVTGYIESVDLGVRYQLSGWNNTLIYENADLGWPKIFDVETGTSNIFNQLAITSLISGTYSPRGAMTIDSNVVGRGAGKPKRQGIALGSQRIFAGIGASTTAASGWTFAGLQGYAEYSLDGAEIGQYLITPGDFKAYWDPVVGLNTQSTENEGIQSCDISGVEEQYLLQSVRYLSPAGVNYRTLNVIRVNCPTNEPGTVDFGPRASSAAYMYNPRGRLVNAGRYPINPADGIASFTSVQAIAEYMRGTDIGQYISYLESDMFMFEGGAGATGQVTIPAFNHVRVDYVNADTWNVTVTGTNRANNYTGRFSKNAGYNAFTKIASRSMSILGSAGLVDVSIRSPNALTLPAFAGDWSTGVSNGSTGGVTNWQPAGTTNGALWESGYAANRVLQMFMSTTSKLFFRYAGDAIRDGNTGWAEAWSTLNTTVDASGFIKKASPVVKIFADGSSETNRESEGVTVTRQAEGEYLVEGCIGLNADAAWGGVDGGFEIPLDRNKQPLVWLDYAVNADGSVLIKTFHRTHDNAPEFARNDISGVSNGDPIDIPADQFVSVRVQMPEDSFWNQTQAQLDKAEPMEEAQ